MSKDYRASYSYNKILLSPNIFNLTGILRTKPQESFFDFCIKTNDLKEIQKYIRINRINILRDSRDGDRNLLHVFAARGKQRDIIQFFIDSGLNVNSKDMHNETPLYILLRARNYITAQVFLDNFADVNIRNEYDKSVLDCFLHDYYPLVITIINHGYIVDSRYGGELDDMTDLHFAVVNKNVQLIELLLQNGWNPNALTKDGYTPLTFAITNEDLEITRLLLQYHANPVQINFTHGTTLIDLTYEIEYREIGIKMRELLSNFISPSLSQLVDIQIICFRQLVLDRLSIKYYRDFDVGRLADDWVHERISTLNITKQTQDIIQRLKDNARRHLQISPSNSSSSSDDDVSDDEIILD